MVVTLSEYGMISNLCNCDCLFCMYSFKKSVLVTLIHPQEGMHCQFNDCFVHNFAYMVYQSTIDYQDYSSCLLQWVQNLLTCIVLSSDHCLLHSAGARTVFGSCAFCHAAPTIWNSPPADLSDNFNNGLLSGFKCSLKTYFYKLSFLT